MRSDMKNFFNIFNLKKYATVQNINIFILIFTFILGVYLNWGMSQIGAFCLLIILILYPVRSKYLLQATLIAIVVSGVLIVINRIPQANQLSSIGYLAILAAVVMVIYESVSEKK
jgi:hypothetical protein